MKKLLGLILVLGLFSCKKELGGDVTPINVPTTTTLSGNINTTTTLTADKVWTLKGYVYVTDGAKLIIQPPMLKDMTRQRRLLCLQALLSIAP